MHNVAQMAMVAAARKWIKKKHLVNVLTCGEWIEMYDADGNKLSGIRGRCGVGEMTTDGARIGADLIEMRPGSAFEPHQHPGDHILYIVAGTGRVLLSGQWRRVCAGDLIFIAAEHAHAVEGPKREDDGPLTFVAFGYPHEHVHSKKRMHHPKRDV